MRGTVVQAGSVCRYGTSHSSFTPAGLLSTHLLCEVAVRYVAAVLSSMQRAARDVTLPDSTGGSNRSDLRVACLLELIAPVCCFQDCI